MPSVTKGLMLIADLLHVGTDQKIAELCIWLGRFGLEDATAYI